MADSTVEGRSEEVKQAVVELKREVEPSPPSSNWLDKVIGIFSDEPAFDELIRLGREFRMAERPDEDRER